MSTKSQLPPFTLGFAGAFLLAACSGLDGTTAETTAALETAQCQYQADQAGAAACRAAFETCVAVEGADLEACRDTLRACLPPPPHGRHGHGPGDADGGHRGPPPFLADGGLPPPRGPGECDGDHDGGVGGPGGHGRGGPGGRGGGVHPGPDAAAVVACHTALEACLTATPGDPACFEAGRTCLHGAFAAAFAAACATASTCDTTTDPDCARLQARCAEGVDGRPSAFDGGTCP